MDLNGQKGQITVFLSVILLAVITLTGVLVDGSRIITAKTQAKRAVDSAIKSALADYSSKLKNQYGIFALSVNDEDKLKETINGYIGKNLMTKDEAVYGTKDSEYINLYDYRIDNLSVTPIFNLTENETVKNQILQYMKYRAPEEIIQGLWDKLSAAKDASKMSEVYKKKTDIDKLAGEAGKLQESLKKSIDGTNGDGSTEDYYINKFNKDGGRDKLVEACCSLAAQYKLLLSLQNAVKKQTGQEDKGVADKIASLKKSLDDSLKTLKEEQTEGYLEANKDAYGNVEDITKLGSQATTAVSELESYIKSSFGDAQDETSKSFVATVEGDVSKLKELLLEGQKAEDMAADLKSNYDSLEASLKQIDGIYGMLDKIKCDIVPTSDLNNITQENMQLYNQIKDETAKALTIGTYNNKIEYDYERAPKADKSSDDPRKGKAEEAEGTLQDGNSEDKKIENIEELPSNKNVQSRDFTKEDNAYLEAEGQSNTPFKDETGQVAGNGAEYEGNLADLGKDIEFQKGDFADKAFGFMGSMAQKLGQGLAGLRDDIYIDEYIMETFKCKVPVITDSNGNKIPQHENPERSSRDSFFDSEVEYILHGSASQNTNELLTKSQILLVRFVMDTLHVYMDGEKRAKAEEIAAAVSGWWTAGAGIPVAANLIMCGWGMGEAVYDLTQLMDGKSIPFYKLKGDWKLDIDGLASNGSSPKSDPRLAFSYQDYLRLFLLLQSTDEKINRIEDLVQLNMQKSNKDFTMSSYHTNLRVEADISIKFLFLTQAFMPKSSKTGDGRYKFRVVLYGGY